MDLDKLNSEYVAEKAVIAGLESKKQEIAGLEKDLKRYTKDIQISEIKMEQYELEEGNEAEIETEKANIGETKEKIGEIRGKLEDHYNALAKAKVKVDDYMKQISENPEIKKQLDEALATNFSRKADKKHEERNKLQGQTNKYVAFQEACKANPEMKKIFDKMIRRKNELEPLKQKKEDGIELNEKETQKYETLVTRIENGQKEIETMSNGRFTEDLIDTLPLHGDIDKAIKANQKQIKGMDKSVRDLDKAAYNHSNTSKATSDKTKVASSKSRGNANELPVPVKQGFFKKLLKGIKNFFTKDEDLEKEDLEIVIKEEIEKEDVVKEGVTSQEDFRNALKYDITRDMLEEMKKEALKEAKKDRKLEESRKPEVILQTGSGILGLMCRNLLRISFLPAVEARSGRRKFLSL
jgi:myosin heavy subunit